MKLVKSIQLFFQEGSSDKVYQIDLLETGEDAFVVNFKYGRRGAALKEGTKTAMSVNRAEAEKIFSSLEDEKRKKGYLPEGEHTNFNPDFTAVKSTSTTVPKKHKLIVKLLKAALNDEEHESWPVSRIIWRAGELTIAEAAPWVLKLVDKDDPVQLYVCIWTLSRIGDTKCNAFFTEITKGSYPSHISNLACAALLNNSDAASRKTIIEQLSAKLPESLKLALKADDSYLQAYLKDHFTKFSANKNDFLIPLYFISNEDEKLRALFIKHIVEVPIKAGYFKCVRQLFKISEMLYDTELYGLLAKSLEKAPYNYSGEYAVIEGRLTAIEEEKIKEDSTLAFSRKTKEYFSRRIVRMLRKYGEEQSTYYTKFACDILLAFDDESDLTPPEKTLKWEYEYEENNQSYSSHERILWFDSYAGYRAFNYILYANSTRYIMPKSRGRWQCVPPYTPGTDFAPLREEAFAVLWNNASEEIIKLLAYSKCSRVTDFALFVFQNNASFKEKINEKDVIQFLLSQSLKVQQLGFKLSMEKYSTPGVELIIAMLKCKLDEARKFAQECISQEPEQFSNNEAFLSSLMLSAEFSGQLWLNTFLLQHRPGNEVLQSVFLTLINRLKGSAIIINESYIAAVAAWIDLFFADAIERLETKEILELLQHPNTLVQGLAAKLLVLKKLDSKEIPDEIIFRLLESENKMSRTAAIDLLNHLSADEIADKQSLVLSLCLSSLQDVRQSAQKLIDKLLLHNGAAGIQLVQLFIPVLTVKEKYEGLHADVLKLISEKLINYLNQIPVKQILSLCTSRYIASQELGNLLLEKHIDADVLSIKDLNVIASSGLLKNRQYVIAYYTTHLQRIKTEKKEAILLADSNWEDVRLFAFDFFGQNFQEEDWDPTLFISLCDSVKHDVQAFGREMITKWFEKDNGFDYLLKLSQHPDQRMQLFASGFLEQFAKNNLEMMSKLNDFFITLLSQINKGRTAKIRCIHLLSKEAVSDEAHAFLIAQIFNRMSATATIQDKALYIEALTEIKKKFPSIHTLVKMHQTPVYKSKQINHVV